MLCAKKPKDPIVDDMGNLIGFETHQDNVPIEQDLKRANCVIAYNSMVALTATMMGIPVIAGPISCCRPVSFSVDTFQSGALPPSFNNEPERRRDLFRWLAHNQWNLAEIRGGLAWRMLQVAQ